MTAPDADDSERSPASPSAGGAGPGAIARRSLIGGLVGAAAVGAAAGAAGMAAVDKEPAGNDAVSPVAAADVPVEATGELVAEDVQGALVEVFERTGALARLDDLRVAHELVDDFVPGPDATVGSLGWTVQARAGASATADPAAEGGVVVLGSGPAGTVGMRVGVEQCKGLPVFTMEWRLRAASTGSGAAPVSLAFGALSSVASADGGVGCYFSVADGSWVAVTAGSGGSAPVETGVDLDDQFHRFRITSDGNTLVRFYVDDVQVASSSDQLPGPDDTYTHGLVLGAGPGGVAAEAHLDWFYLRRELPR